jgi:hypothetical protein
MYSTSTSNIGYFTKGCGAEVTFESIYIMCVQYNVNVHVKKKVIYRGTQQYIS